MSPALLKKMDFYLSELSRLSSVIGNNRALVQGSGGNTSVKCENRLYVKASGFWLKDALKKNIFIPVSLPGVSRRLKRGENDPVSPEVVKGEKTDGMRPSIETTLHALMPHRFVIHVHPVNVIAYCILENGREKLEHLLADMKWAWIPYARPGLPLTCEVQKVIHSKPDIIVLANHGLVIGADSTDDVFDLLNKLEKRLNRPLRNFHQQSNNKLIELVGGTGYRLPKHELIHAIALDRTALNIANTRSLYPDHVVFLGPGPMPVMGVEKARTWFASQKPEKDNHKAIIVRDVGVIVHESLSEGAEEMLRCLADILLRVQSGEKLCYLTENDEAELMVWDAEKYRQSI